MIFRQHLNDAMVQLFELLKYSFQELIEDLICVSTNSLTVLGRQ
nr:MAG TPA: hypothetical protein [Caudoviricetes sp.]